MAEFLSYIFSLLVVAPLQTEITERMQGMPADIMQAGRTCISAQAPELLQRAQNDWPWAASNAVGVWVGAVDPVTLLQGTNPDCNRVVSALNEKNNQS